MSCYFIERREEGGWEKDSSSPSFSRLGGMWGEVCDRPFFFVRCKRLGCLGGFSFILSLITLMICLMVFIDGGGGGGRLIINSLPPLSLLFYAEAVDLSYSPFLVFSPQLSSSSYLDSFLMKLPQTHHIFTSSTSNNRRRAARSCAVIFQNDGLRFLLKKSQIVLGINGGKSSTSGTPTSTTSAVFRRNSYVNPLKSSLLFFIKRRSSNEHSSSSSPSLSLPSSSLSINEDITTPLPASSSSSLSHSSSLSAKKQWLKFLAGGFAGTIASALTTPIEVVKTQLQSSAGTHRSFFSAARDIFNAGGVRAFYRGLAPTLIGIIPTRAIFFWGYATAKSAALEQTGMTEKSPLVHIIAAIFAGVVSNSASNPIWMIRTRMQLLSSSGKNPYSSYREAIAQIWRNEGVGGFMKGVIASYWGVSESCINWVLYERMKAAIKGKLESKTIFFESDDYISPTATSMSPLIPICNSKQMRHVLQAINRLRFSLASQFDRLPENVKLCLAAGVSKLVASSLTYPHEVVRTRVREEAVGGVFKYTGMLQAIRLIYFEEGLKGLYAGVGTHLLRVVPNNAILLTSYEIINRWLEKYFRDDSACGEEGKKQQENNNVSNKFKSDRELKNRRNTEEEEDDENENASRSRTSERSSKRSYGKYYEYASSSANKNSYATKSS